MYICLRFRNPFSKKNKWVFEDLVQKEVQISKNKWLEYSYGSPSKDVIFGLTLGLRFSGQDHAGPELEVCILGWEARIALIDRRHWNHDANRWNNEDEY